MSNDPLAFGPDHGTREAWLFTLFVTSDDAARWEPPRPGAERDWPLIEALGAGPLDPRHVSVFESIDLGPEGLRKFLSGAIGMDEAQVNADAEKLDMIRGTVALVQSAALKERPGRFAPKNPANFIGHYSEPRHLLPPNQFPPSESTKGHIPPPAAPASPATGQSTGTRRALIAAVLALLIFGALLLALT